MTKDLIFRSLVLLLPHFIFQATYGKSFPGLVVPSSSYTVPDEAVIPKYVPECRSADGLNICGPATAALLIDSARCEEKKISPCSQMPIGDRSSYLDMIRLATKVPDPKDIETYPREVAEGGSGSVALYNAAFNTRQVAREACAPFDSFVSKLATKEEQEAAELKIWAGLKDAHDQYKKFFKSGCAKCAIDLATTTANTLIKEKGLKNDPVAIIESFKQETYQKFLGQFLIPEKCSEESNLVSTSTMLKKFAAWPSLEKDMSYQATLDKIKTVLIKSPIMVNRVCLQDPPTEDCGGVKNSKKHTNAIVGYALKCKVKAKPTDPKDCVALLKVENNWGCGWNRENNDGWVLAEPFLNHTMYSKKNLQWLADVGASDLNGENPGD
ncbi:MAG: hypothetical protein H7333_11375 [Bdellovibrionales bacterium]|nr:hypothetical protein [Oligoflexia bacterium]